MGKDILIIGSVYRSQAEYFYYQIAEAIKETPETTFTIRVNCDGGEPAFGMSIIAKIQELFEEGKIDAIKVEGQAHSFGLFFLCYVDPNIVTVIDTAQAVLHRGAYPDYIEESTMFKGSVFEDILVKTNKDLEKAFRAKVNVEALESLKQFKEKNLTLKDIFSMDSRQEVLLTAQDLKKIGLAKKIITITPQRSEQIAAAFTKFKDCQTIESFKVAAQSEIPKDTSPKSEIIMDAKELKEKYPAIHTQIFNEGKEAGKTEGAQVEKDRVEAIMVFAEIDPTAVKAAIESGKPLTAKQINELNLKAINTAALGKVAADNAANVQGAATGQTQKTPEQIKAETETKFMGEVDKFINKPVK